MEEIIFPNKIRILRKLRGLSMQELAARLGVSLSAISKIEKGYRKINQEQIAAVADFLNCSMTDIFISEENDDRNFLSMWKSEIERRRAQNKENGLKIFGAGLHCLRGSKNMTLMDIAEAAGLTLSVYHRIEIGQREIYGKELDAIAKALGMTSREVLARIYELKSDGALDRFMEADSDPIDSIARMSDIIKTTESVHTPGGVVKFHKVFMYSRTLDDGNVMVEPEHRDYAVYPISERKTEGVYAIELSSRRLGNSIPMRSILFLDRNQAVRSGDMAAQVVREEEGKMEIRLISVREDIDGKFYAVSYNPDEKQALSGAELAKLHRVVLISMN
jgi:transcriptional regulator with XRE-family HTH domain